METLVKQEIKLRDLGIADYQSVCQKMQSFTVARDADTADEIWLVEHPPVFTQGRHGSAEHILNPGNIPVVHSDRGGQVTYHGPGQLVVYFLVDLKRAKLGAKSFVFKLEQAVLDLLTQYNINADRKCKAPGVYVNDAKICSIGLRIKKSCTYHGIALNVDMDLEPFSRINPCGFENLSVTQIKDFVTDVSMKDVKRQLLELVRNVILSE